MILLLKHEETDYKKALKGNPLSCLTTMYDRSVVGDLYFDETYNRHEDYIFWLTILKRGIVAKDKFSDEILFKYSLTQRCKMIYDAIVN